MTNRGWIRIGPIRQVESIVILRDPITVSTGNQPLQPVLWVVPVLTLTGYFFVVLFFIVFVDVNLVDLLNLFAHLFVVQEHLVVLSLELEQGRPYDLSCYEYQQPYRGPHRLLGRTGR